MSVPLFRKVPSFLAGFLLAPLVLLAQVDSVPVPDGARESTENGEAGISRGIADVIRQVDEAEEMVAGLEQSLASPDPELEEAGSRLSELRASVEGDLNAVDGVPLDQYSALDLGGRLQVLVGAERRLREIRTLLQRTIDRLDGERTRLRGYVDIPNMARTVDADPLPATLRERIERIGTSVGAQRARLDQRLGVAVAQLDGATEFQRQLAGSIAKIQNELTRRQQSLFKLNEPPIWQISAAGAESLLTILGREVDNLVTGVVEYLRLHAVAALLFGLLFVILLVVGRRLPGLASRRTGEHSSLIVRSPLTVLVLVWALLGPELFLGDLTAGLDAVRALLITGALWLLLPRLVSRPLLLPLRAVLLGTLLVYGENHLLGDPFYGRLLLLVLGVAAFFLFYLLRRRVPAGPDRGTVSVVASWLARLAPPLLAIGVVANVAGAVFLSSEIVGSVLFIATALVALAAVNAILRELLVAFVHGPGGRWSRAIHRNPQLVLQRTGKTIGIVLTVMFILYLPRMVPVIDPVWRSVSEVLRAPFPIGTLQLSIFDVVVFVLGVTLAVVVARLVRFLLDEDVFSRLPVAPGTASAASRLIYYALMLGGLMFAFAAAGVEMGQLTLIVGALSLGIGFGLQNIVNNFVSGIVIAFERPFREGDQITVGNISGVIQEIGLRASRLRTFDGAELIVPNGNLISGEVSNWTLSDRARRTDIRVGVSYDSNPRQVEKILLDIARAEKRISVVPAPGVSFDDFGDNALIFTLRFWTADSDYRQDVANEVRFRIIGAFAEAGIRFRLPVPAPGPPPAKT